MAAKHSAEHEPEWHQQIGPDERAELMSDDSKAWRSVTGELIFIVSVGLVMAIVTVIIVANS
ncbi:hypothetical protein Psta_1592 [Pirellula staleyi DSM 6068]|uniref:Uncharacterized protein n=1 Tax=Pirellula staleyi (strain ATCC 27377 / DSM 6068 / ICPB 4128) TaxID=530564 RepID=D2QY53_PIRSD|nr:hypothetical protein [Pirellula staleyi]ADB16267.1 hypothetical protein Psta_1592 [Pirellula staleyi DSM 6068]